MHIAAACGMGQPSQIVLFVAVGVLRLEPHF
jgi:hypothetical protein